MRNQGIDIRVLMVDYAGKLASISRDREDFERISNVYVDLQNLAEELHLDILWTAHHITREGKNIDLLDMMRMISLGQLLLYVMPKLSWVLILPSKKRRIIFFEPR